MRPPVVIPLVTVRSYHRVVGTFFFIVLAVLSINFGLADLRAVIGAALTNTRNSICSRVRLLYVLLYCGSAY
jgi:phage tail protein X